MFILASKNNYASNFLFKKLRERTNEHWSFIFNKEELKLDILQKHSVNKIFFFHWSYIVPKSIYNKYECINIHTSNLPHGKGGSPLQNQIMDNIIQSRVNALRMSDAGLDAGPIYCSQDITLQGNLNDIWIMLSSISYKLITNIIDNHIQPVKQSLNDYPIYKRRRNNQIPFEEKELVKIYNFIRMLDGTGYPNPYLEISNFRLEFNRANFDGEKIHTDVIITTKIN